MTLAVSIFSVVFVCITAVILRVRGTRLAYIWLMLFSVSFIIWTFLILSVPTGLQPFTIKDFYNPGPERIDIVYQLTEQSRLAGIGTFSLLLAYLATETAHQNGNQSLFHWIEFLINSVAVWLVLLSGNVWTVLISWTILDMIGLILMLIYRHMKSSEFIPHYTYKFIGSMILVFIFSVTYQSNQENIFGSQFSNLGIWVLASVFLYAGFLFKWRISNLPQKISKHLLLQRFLIYIANFYLLTQVTDGFMSPILQLFMQIALFFIAFYSAFRWYSGKNEFSQVSHLFSAIAALTGYIFLFDDPFSSIFLLMFALPLSWIFLYTERDKRLNWLVLLPIFLFSGIPFSLSFSGFENLIGENHAFEIGVLVIPVSFLIAGITKFSKLPNREFEKIERPNQTVYIIGLLFPVISAGFLIYSSNLKMTISNLWFGVLQMVTFLTVNFFSKRLPGQKLKKLDGKFNVSWIMNVKLLISNVIIRIIALAGDALHFAARLFEEQGGVMWAIVFLSLLLTVIAFEGGLS